MLPKGALLSEVQDLRLPPTVPLRVDIVDEKKLFNSAFIASILGLVTLPAGPRRQGRTSLKN